MSVRLSVLPSPKISVTTEPIHSLGNIPTGPVVVLAYFLKGMGHPPPNFYEFAIYSRKFPIHSYFFQLGR